MRAPFLWLVPVVLVASLGGVQPVAAQADDFDDDFASEGSAKLATPAIVQTKTQVPADQKAAATPGNSTPIVPQNTLLGPVGGIHAVDAGSGPAGTFRLSATGQLFRKNGFLFDGDEHRRVGGTLSLSATPIEHLELAAAFTTYSNESTSGRRDVYQVIGDSHLFVKAYHSILPMLTIGADVELALLNGIGGIGISSEGTSVGLRGNVSADLRKLDDAMPLVLRYSLRYYFDNSAKLARDAEASRYASLNDAAPERDEVRNLVSDVERFAFQINRVDMLSMSFGVEAPLTINKRFGLSPIVEWNLGIPVNRQGYNCVIPQAEADRDSCLSDKGFAAWPTTFTVGMRVSPWLRGLSVLLAADIATSGQKTTVRELAPNAAYDLLLSVGYAYDVREPKPVVIEKTLLVTKEPEKLGHILGEIVDRDTGLAVPRAIVSIVGTELTDLSASEQGRFITAPLEAGTYKLHIRATDYEEADCDATLAAGGVDQLTRCTLVPAPKLGSLSLTVVGENGAPVSGAVVRVTGTKEATLNTDAQGAVSQGELPEGNLTLRIEAEGFLVQQVSVSIARGKPSEQRIVLTPKPQKPMAELKAKVIVIKRQVQFVSNSAEIRSESNGLMAEVADILLRNPQVTKVEIQGHTDDQGGLGKNQELSQKRAEAVRNWLMTAGVEGERLVAVGYGPNRPLMPNITPDARAKNRRVEFHVLEQR